MDPLQHFCKAFASNLARWKDKSNCWRWKPSRTATVTLKDLFEDDQDMIERFGDLFRTEHSKVWLHSETAVLFNNQQSYGARRELILTKHSKITYKKLYSYLRCQQSSAILSPSIPAVIAPDDVATSSTTSTALSSPLTHAITIASDDPSTSSSSTPMATPPPATPSPPQTARLLSRLKKRKVEYEDASIRVKQRVARELTSELCDIIEKKVAVDNKYITHGAIMRTCADSADRGNKNAPSKRVSPVRAQRRVLASDPVVQAQVRLYLAPGATKKERNRVLSTFSRRFTRKELNTIVFRRQDTQITVKNNNESYLS